MTAQSMLTTRTPAVALRALSALPEDPISAWDDVVRGALRGNAGAVRSYVASGKSLIRAILVVAHDAKPDVVGLDGSSVAIFLEPGHRGIDAMEVLELAIPDAPLSPWTSAYGLGDGTALALLSRVRAAVPGGRPLPFPRDKAGGLPELVSDGPGFERFRLLVWDALRADALSPLAELETVFGLDHTATARLFRVTRQAIGDWLKRGVPAERSAKLVTMLQLGRLLEHRLRPGLVPGVARRPAAAYGDRTMLDLLAAGEHEALLEMTRATFDWSATA